MAATRVRDWPGVLPLPRSSKDAHTHGTRRRVEPMIVGVAHRDGQVRRADAGWYARLSKSARLVEPEHPLQCATGRTFCTSLFLRKDGMCAAAEVEVSAAASSICTNNVHGFQEVGARVFGPLTAAGRK